MRQPKPNLAPKTDRTLTPATNFQQLLDFITTSPQRRASAQQFSQGGTPASIYDIDFPGVQASASPFEIPSPTTHSIARAPFAKMLPSPVMVTPNAPREQDPANTDANVPQRSRVLTPAMTPPTGTPATTHKQRIAELRARKEEQRKRKADLEMQTESARKVSETDCRIIQIHSVY